MKGVVEKRIYAKSQEKSFRGGAATTFEARKSLTDRYGARLIFPRIFSTCQTHKKKEGAYLMELSKWFQAMDYMYQLYDMLYQVLCLQRIRRKT